MNNMINNLKLDCFGGKTLVDENKQIFSHQLSNKLWVSQASEIDQDPGQLIK